MGKRDWMCSLKQKVSPSFDGFEKIVCTFFFCLLCCPPHQPKKKQKNRRHQIHKWFMSVMFRPAAYWPGDHTSPWILRAQRWNGVQNFLRFAEPLARWRKSGPWTLAKQRITTSHVPNTLLKTCQNIGLWVFFWVHMWKVERNYLFSLRRIFFSSWASTPSGKESNSQLKQRQLWPPFALFIRCLRIVGELDLHADRQDQSLLRFLGNFNKKNTILLSLGGEHNGTSEALTSWATSDALQDVGDQWPLIFMVVPCLLLKVYLGNERSEDARQALRSTHRCTSLHFRWVKTLTFE